MKIPSAKQSPAPALSSPVGMALGSSPFEHRVARAISACTRCRSRKSKCDGKLPACSACEKAGVPCQGFDAIAKKNVSRSYIYELENEVMQLRAQLGLPTGLTGDGITTSSGTNTPSLLTQSQPAIKIEPSSNLGGSRSPLDEHQTLASGYLAASGNGHGNGNAEAGPSSRTLDEQYQDNNGMGFPSHQGLAYGNGGSYYPGQPHHQQNQQHHDPYSQQPHSAGAGPSRFGGSRSDSMSTPTQRDIDGVISDIAFAGKEAASDLPRPVGHYLGTASGVSLTRMVLDAVLREGVASGPHAGTGLNNTRLPPKREGSGGSSFQPAMSRPDSPDHNHARSGSSKLPSPLEQSTSNFSSNGHTRGHSLNSPPLPGSPPPRPISVPALPPPAAVDRLVQVYVDFVQIMVPILHMPTFEKQLARVRDRSPDVQDADIFFVLMVLALSTMALSRSLDPTAELRMSSEAFYVEATKHMEPIFEDQTYRGLQAILLCCSYSLLNPRRGSIWFLVGLASRTAVDHGLHHETDQSENLSPLELDMRRRLFHAVYNLDRLLGHALGRPPSIPDEYISVPQFSSLPDSAITEHSLLPAEPDPYKLVAINFIKLRQLQSAINARLYSVTVKEPPSEEWFVDMFEELKTWLANSPEPKGASSTEGYAISFHNTVMLLFRPSPACPRPSRDALATCLSSSSYIIRIFRTIQRKNKINWFWLTSHYVFMAGITYLYGLWNMNLIGDSSVTPSLRDAVLDCQACLATLDALAITVPSARACKSTFEMLSTAIVRRLTGEQGIDSSEVGIEALGQDLARSPAPLGSTSVHAESAMRHSFQSQGLPSPLPRLELPPTELNLLESLFLNPMVPHPKASQSTHVGQHPPPTYPSPAAQSQGMGRNGQTYDYPPESTPDYQGFTYGTPGGPALPVNTVETPSSMYNLATAAAAMTPSAETPRDLGDVGSSAFPDSSDLAAGGFDFLSFLAADDGGQGANAVWEQTEQFRQDMPMMG